MTEKAELSDLGEVMQLGPSAMIDQLYDPARGTYAVVTPDPKLKAQLEQLRAKGMYPSHADIPPIVLIDSGVLSGHPVTKIREDSVTLHLTRRTGGSPA